MRIKVSKTMLIRQFPDLRLPLIQMDDEDYLYIEGEDATEKNRFLQEYPDAWKQFSKTELRFLNELYTFKLIPRKQLTYLVSGADVYMRPNSNVIDVHIKNIRRRFKLHNIPFNIKTHRGYGYILQRLEPINV